MNSLVQAAIVGGATDIGESSKTHALDSLLIEQHSLVHRILALIDGELTGIDNLRAYAVDAMLSGEAHGRFRDLVLASPGLVAYYEANEASGDLTDSFDSHLAVYYENTVVAVYQVPSFIGLGVQLPEGAFAFTNTCYQIDRTPANPDNSTEPIDRSAWKVTTFTIEAWVRIETNGGRGTILSYGMDNNSGWALHYNSDGVPDPTAEHFQFELVLNDHYGNYVTPFLFERDTWYHVVATLDDATSSARIYVNGVLRFGGATSEAPDYSTPTIDDSIRAPKIGATYNIQFLPFIGILDEVVFYNEVMSAAEVLKHFNVGSGEVNTVQHDLDSFLIKTVTRAQFHEVQSWLSGQYHYYMDSLIALPTVTTYSLDSLLTKTSSHSHGADSLLIGRLTKHHQVNSLISGVPRSLVPESTITTLFDIEGDNSTAVDLIAVVMPRPLELEGLMAIRTRGETVIIQLTIKSGGVLADPSDTPTVSITDPTGELVVDGDDMSQVSTGLWSYDYQTDTDSVLGWYKVRFVVTDNTRVTQEDDGFELKP